jgi:hypothetical protein
MLSTAQQNVFNGWAGIDNTNTANGVPTHMSLAYLQQTAGGAGSGANGSSVSAVPTGQYTSAQGNDALGAYDNVAGLLQNQATNGRYPAAELADRVAAARATAMRAGNQAAQNAYTSTGGNVFAQATLGGRASQAAAEAGQTATDSLYSEQAQSREAALPSLLDLASKRAAIIANTQGGAIASTGTPAPYNPNPSNLTGAFAKNNWGWGRG